MSFGRKVISGVLSTVLVLLLFSLAIDTGFLRIAGHPNTIESILDKSGIYNSVIPGLLDEAKTVSSSGGNIPLKDPIVRSAATSAFTPQYLSSNVNQALDSIYQWLDGKTPQPKFVINLVDQKTAFANKVAAGAKHKAAALPRCHTKPRGSFDVFSAKCLPAGVSPAQAGRQVRSNILNGQGFLDNTMIRAGDLKANNSNQSVFADQLKNLPQGYKNFKKSPIVLALLCLLFGLLVILLYRPKLRGLRHVGFILVGTGIFVTLLALGINEAVSNKVLSNVTLNNAVLQSSLRTVIHDFSHNLATSYMVMGLIYVVLGAVAVAIYYFFRRQQPADAPAPASPPKPDLPKAAPAPKKPAKKIKIQ